MIVSCQAFFVDDDGGSHVIMGQHHVTLEEIGCTVSEPAQEKVSKGIIITL